jgi:hypothetical protein
MWNIGNLDHDKRGAGSIIGVVFIVLILLTGFTFYSLNINLTEEYTGTVQDMQELDFRRNKENIEFSTVSRTTENKLNITVKNIGAYQSHLIWLGVLNETATPDNQDYYELDIYIDPVDKATNIGLNITISTSQLRIQLITELGNIFSCSFPAEESHYDFVDEEGTSPTIGSHSLFSAQQAGPDGIVDILTEENTSQPVNYELDLEVQWLAADYDEANEWLCIHGGAMGAEDLRVDVWNGTNWIIIFSDLESGWNSINVSSYLTSHAFKIRFRASSDATQHSWEIDATFLHVWS